MAFLSENFDTTDNRVGVQMIKTKWKIVLLAFSLSVGLQAQVWQNFKTDTKDFFQTGSDLGFAVWNSENTAKLHFALASAGVAALTLLDQPVRDYALQHQSTFGDRLFGIDNYYGEKWYMLGGMSVLYFGGLFSGNQNIRKAGLQTAEAYFYTGVLGIVVKELFGRARPYTDEGRYSFKPFRLEESHRSFFSGHSSTVFAVSTVMAGQLDNLFWKMGWYTAAVLVAGARMYHDQHWLSDVTGGALIGFGIGHFVLDRNGGSKVQVTGSASAAQPLQVGFAFRF